MGFLRVKSCCCGSSLRSGCTKIAIVNLSFCIFGLLSGLGSAGPSNIGGSLLGIIANVLLYQGVKTDKKGFVAAYLIIAGIQLAMCVVGFFLVVTAGIFLSQIDFAQMDNGPKTGMDDPYNFNSGSSSSQRDFFRFLSGTGDTGGDMEQTSDGGIDVDADGRADFNMAQAGDMLRIVVIVLSIFTIVATALYSYLWIVVYSFFQELKEGGGNGGQQQADAVLAAEGGFSAIPPNPYVMALPVDNSAAAQAHDGPPPPYEQVTSKSAEEKYFMEKC
jgi:hypothetical protein